MLLGNIVAMILPYLRKQYKLSLENHKLEFDMIYLWNTVIAVFMEFLFALPVIAVMQSVESFTEVVGLIIMSFAFGYGGNRVQIESSKLYSVWRLIRSSSSGRPSA